MNRRMNDVEFLNLYIEAIKKKMNAHEFASSIGKTYQHIMNRKRRIAILTNKKLPPLVRKTGQHDVATIIKLVDTSYAEHKRVFAKKK